MSLRFSLTDQEPRPRLAGGERQSSFSEQLRSGRLRQQPGDYQSPVSFCPGDHVLARVNLPGFVVRFWVAAGLLRVHLWFHLRSLRRRKFFSARQKTVKNREMRVDEGICPERNS